MDHFAERAGPGWRPVQYTRWGRCHTMLISTVIREKITLSDHAGATGLQLR
jgi:hypothetical protein